MMNKRNLSKNYLREEIGHEFIMIGNRFTSKINWSLGLAETNEFSRNNSSYETRFRYNFFTK